jgi:hypothetical protein
MKINTETVFAIANILISLFASGVLFFGLRTWRLQLKGENKYKLSLKVIRYLKKVIENITTYRNPIITADEEYNALEKHNKLSENNDKPIDDRIASEHVYIERWNNIINQYFIYEDKILDLKIILNNYNLDIINDKTIVYYIKQLKNMKIIFANTEKQLSYNLDKENIQRIRKENDEARAVLFNIWNKNDKNDKFGYEIDMYFNEINKRLRKYLK